MPKSTMMDLRCVLALVAALAVAAMCCSSAGAIVGGEKVSGPSGHLPPTGPLDYQVALIRNDRPTTSSGQFCGGSVRDDPRGQPQRIVTAAHCVFDNSATAPGQPIAAANLDVLAGTPLLTDDTNHRLHVAAISIDPRYDPATLSHDAAVVTLAGTAPLDATGARSIPFLDDDGWTPSPSISAVVSGWGRIDNVTYPTDLRWVQMPLADRCCLSGELGGTGR